jgi:hypothetical protein
MDCEQDDPVESQRKRWRVQVGADDEDSEDSEDDLSEEEDIEPFDEFDIPHESKERRDATTSK